MTTETILEKFERLGVRLRIDGDHIIAKPMSAVPPDLRKAVTEHKDEFIEAIQLDEALRLLNRLKTFTLPTSRIAQARAMFERVASIASAPIETRKPAEILTELREIENELIALGATPDAELSSAVAMIERSFPGTRLVEVRKPRQRSTDIDREEGVRANLLAATRLLERYCRRTLLHKMQLC